MVNTIRVEAGSNNTNSVDDIYIGRESSGGHE